MKIPNAFSPSFNRKLISLLVCLFIVIANVASVMPQKNFAARNVMKTFEIYKDPSSKVRETKDSKDTAKSERDKAFTPQTSNPQKAELVVQTGLSTARSVAISPDGIIMAVSDEGGTVKLFDVKSGKELRSLRNTSSDDYMGVGVIAFTHDSKKLCTFYDSQTIKFWSVSDGSQVESVKLPLKADNLVWVNSITFSPNGKLVAILSTKDSENKVEVWDLSNARIVKTFTPDKSYKEIVFAEDGKLLISEYTESEIKLRELESGKVLKTFNIDTEYLMAHAFTPDLRRLLSLQSNDLKLWDVKTNKELNTIDLKSTKFRDVFAINKEKKNLAVADWNERIFVWDLSEGKLLGQGIAKAVSRSDREVIAMSFNSNGSVLLSTHQDGLLRLWDVNGMKLILEYETRLPHRDYSFLFKQYSFPTDVFEIKDSFKVHLTEDLVISREDETRLKIINLRSNSHVATLIGLGLNGLVIITPEGRFDASEGAQKLMHFVVGLEPIDLEQIKDRYYQPKLLEKIMKGEPLRAVTPFTGDELYPLVKYEPPKQGQKNFTIGLKNRGGGIGAVQVFINGKEFIADARPKNFDSKQKETTITVDLSNAPFIAGKENVVKVYARNSAGWLRSRGSESLYQAEGKEVQETPHLYAIIGGVSDYAEDKLDLRYAAKDAEDFARAVEMGASKLLGKERVHIRLLTSGAQQKNAILSVTDSKQLAPTKENFKKSFEEFRKAKPTDIFIIYLSGHGTSINKGGDTGDTYLYLMQDATTTDSVKLLDEKLRDATTISSDELVAWIKVVPALKQAMVLDTCAAGAAETSLFAKRDLPTDQIRAIDRLKDRTGFFVLMGSAANAQAYEATRYGQGLLTYALLQGMQGAKLKDSEYADVSLLFNYASDLVPDMAKGIGGIQQPRIIAPTESRSFDIGRFTSEEKSRFTLARIKPLILRPALQNDKLKFDNLRLTPLLTKALRDASHSTTRGGRDESPLVFVDADEMYDAITPSGVYEINGETLKLTIVLVKNNNAVKTLSITGNINDKEVLIRDLVKTVTEAAQGLQMQKEL